MHCYVQVQLSKRKQQKIEHKNCHTTVRCHDTTQSKSCLSCKQARC